MKKRILSLLLFSLSLSLWISPIGKASEVTGSEVVSIAKQYIGVPYRMGGTTPSAFDCSGFLIYVFNQVDINLPRTSAEQYGVGTAVNKSDLQPGDLVFFKNTYKAGISHAGIYIGNQQFISATSSKGVKIDSINDPYYWGSRYAGARRVLIEEEPKKELRAVSTLAAGEYVDVMPNTWSYEAVTSLSKDGVITGAGNNAFLPNKAITRAEAAKMLSETFNLQPSGVSVASYQDVATHWAKDYIIAATENEFFRGYGNDTFQPNEPITRAEVAALFARAFELQSNGENKSFTDLPAGHWAYEEIQSLAANGITGGYEDNTFRASKETTRAEFATFLYRGLQYK